MTTPTFLLALLVFIGALFVTWRIGITLRPQSPWQWIMILIGWVLGFLIIHRVAGVMAPRYFVNTQSDVAAAWDPVWGQTADVGRETLAGVTGWLGFGGDNTQYDYAGDIPGQPVPFPNAQPPVLSDLNVPEVQPGQPADLGPAPPGWQAQTAPQTAPQTTVAPEPQVQPTVSQTDTMKLALYQQLADAKAVGALTQGEALLQTLHDLDAGDQTAQRYRQEITQAKTRLENYASLDGIPWSLTINKTHETRVHGVLRGGSYVTVNSGARIDHLSCEERATVQDITPGWTYGATFQVRRCYLSQFKAMGNGDRFTVR